MSSKSSELLSGEIASLLIPLGKGSLLVPNTNVAEIVPFIEPEAVAGKPDWFLGHIIWRDLSLPCISFERCNTEEDDSEYRNERLAILNRVSKNGGPSFYALAIRGIPRLVRVVAEDLVEEEGECAKFEQAKVKLNGELAVVPDLVALEKVVAFNEQMI